MSAIDLVAPNSNFTWIVTSMNWLVCLETGSCIAIALSDADLSRIDLNLPALPTTIVLYSFNGDEKACEKKFEELKAKLVKE